MKNYKRYFIADPHFGHTKMIEFVNDQGEIIRPFKSIEEMEDLIIENWNKVVRPQDRVYMLGDVVIYKKGFEILDKLIGKKYLIKGNHDIFPLKAYTPYFKDIRAYKVMPEYGIICSHIPVHPNQFVSGKFKYNLHGHLHQNLLDDKRYINLCVEHTNYKPVELEEILKKLNITP